MVVGVGKGVLFREVSSVQECPHRERERGSTGEPVTIRMHTHPQTHTHNLHIKSNYSQLVYTPTIHTGIATHYREHSPYQASGTNMFDVCL